MVKRPGHFSMKDEILKFTIYLSMKQYNTFKYGIQYLLYGFHYWANNGVFLRLCCSFFLNVSGALDFFL